MNRKFLYIINPISGTRDKKKLQELIHDTTTKAGCAFSCYPSVASGDYAYLIPIIREQGFTDIVMAGGDGTINKIVNSLKSLQLPFGILPVGSGNGLAFSAGIPKKLDKAMEVLFSGKPEWTDAFTVNESFACMLSGLGLDAQVAHDFAGDPNRGLATYVKRAISGFISAKTFSFTIKARNSQIKTQAFFISVANSNQFGNQVTIAPFASLHDGLLDIVVITRQHKLNMLLQALNQVSGYYHPQILESIDGKAGVIYFQTDHLEITNHHHAPQHIDGDPVETMQHLNIRMEKKCFQLICP